MSYITKNPLSELEAWRCSYGMLVKGWKYMLTEICACTVIPVCHDILIILFWIENDLSGDAGWILCSSMAWYLSYLGHVDNWRVSIHVFDQSWRPHIIPVLLLSSKGCERLSECALAFLITLCAMEGHMVRLLAHPECQSPQAGIFWVLVPG